jgi:hypothetical protein
VGKKPVKFSEPGFNASLDKTPFFMLQPFKYSSIQMVNVKTLQSVELLYKINSMDTHLVYRIGPTNLLKQLCNVVVLKLKVLGEKKS